MANYKIQFKDAHGNFYYPNILSGEVLPIGSMLPFCSTTNIPSNWKICDGSEVSRTAYAELFNIIGTAYGEGDGVTTFNLPDKRGRISVGLDIDQSEFNTIGKKGGSKYLQAHKHNVLDGSYSTPPNVFGYNDASGYNVPSIKGVHSNGTGGKLITDTVGTGDSGNLQPYEVDIWIIKVSNLVSNLDETTGTIIDNLTSTSSTDALSANMGRELKEKLEKSNNWKLHATTTGTGTINLPAEYNELYIEISRTGYTDPIMNLYVPRASLTASARTFRNGYYFNSSVHGAIGCVISLTTYRTGDLYISGTAYNSSALTNIYYR